MGLTSRLFLLHQSDGLYRLPSTKFEQMLRDPTSHRFARFAGSRVRMADVVVELCNRQAIRVVRTRVDGPSRKRKQIRSRMSLLD